MTGHRTALAARAEAVLRANDRGGFTLPSAHLYPHQWAWDSGFAAIGWCHLDLERAAAEVDAILEGQWDDGRIPHIQFRSPTPDYYPGPEVWGRSTSTISNPPIWTLAVERLWQLGFAPDRIREWLGPLERSHQFLGRARDPHNLGCIATCHPWENGQDNCPAWDEPLQAVDPAGSPTLARVDKERVADASQRPTDDHYRRYLSLVSSFRNNGFRPGAFLVYDPFFTTLVIKAEQALARVAQSLGFESEAAPRAERLRQGLVEHLWSAERGRYHYLDALSGETIESCTIGTLAPAILGVEIAGFERMQQHLLRLMKCSYPLPSVDPDHASYNPVCYWRGPSWVNINWLFMPVCPAELRTRTLSLIEEQGFWEYYHPQTGQGLGSDAFTWTAALALDMLYSDD